ncbi:hypothetical protein Tco_0875310 [Tanacetum coccineum]|uniref:Uncharacterized protein n=1 Tax=Tanacetum coccineum TaxID=301880 RepID=A0ABQ5BTZ8_9ASTR
MAKSFRGHPNVAGLIPDHPMRDKELTFRHGNNVHSIKVLNDIESIRIWSTDEKIGAAGYGRSQNRVGTANPGQVRQVKCYNCNEMLLMQAQENGVVLDEEQLLFLASGQDNAIDEDMDEQPRSGLMLQCR